MYKWLTIALFLVFGNICFAQNISTWKQKPQVKFSGLLDLFYAYDFNQPKTKYRQPFFYNHNRHNEFNLNLGILKASVTHKKYRANLALQAGTYSNENYATEPGLLKNIFEANVGISLNKKNNLWLDAGIYGSHIGFEGALSTDNWTLTRSLLAENSPYYLTGAKITYNANLKWEFVAMVCNGWQHIQKVSGNSLPSYCTQLKYTPSNKSTLNWSTFIGTNDPDSTRRMRYFNNFYGQFQVSEKFGLIMGFDIGIQQRTKKSLHHDYWYSPVMIVRYAFTNKWAAALRTEYYQDATGIIIPTGTKNGFSTNGVSLNLDYSPKNNLYFRLEGRRLSSRDFIFVKGNNYSRDNFFLVASVAIRFFK